MTEQPWRADRGRSTAGRAPRWTLALALGLWALGCSRSRDEQSLSDEEPSPNASILPAPLASGGSTVRGGKPGATKAVGEQLLAVAQAPLSPPRPFPLDRELASEQPPGLDVGGFELHSGFVWPGLEGKVARWHDEGTGDEVHAATRPEVTILVGSTGELSWEWSSPVGPLPRQSSIRARTDRFGYVVVWPEGRGYRVAPRGSLRALLQERRVDVAPLVEGEAGEPSDGHRLGMATRTQVIRGPLGEVVLESAVGATPEGGGVLLCRFLLELGRVAADEELCGAADLPLGAHYRWKGLGTSGELVFQVSAARRVQSLAAAGMTERLQAPPLMPIFKPGELPPDAGAELWSSEAQDSLVGARGDRQGLLLKNSGEVPRYLVVDKLPWARVAALAEERVVWPGRWDGRSLASRDFLGVLVEPGRGVEGKGSFDLALRSPKKALPAAPPVIP